MVLALTAGLPVASCGSDVAAFECSAESKQCRVDGQLTCIPRNDPRYGCGSDTCLSCGSQGFKYVKASTCDLVRGVCFVSACEDGYKHCEGPESGGCETPILSSTRHCGACNHACPAVVANGQPDCISGKCAPVCNAGFFDCDKQVDNGCECAAPMRCEVTACVP